MSEPLSTDETRRTAAAWVAGTGAFLLLAAATVFTAVRWDEIAPLGKLGVLCGVTVGFLALGVRLRPTLPATGAAVLHLGTLLVPVDVAAVALHEAPGWPAVLLLTGLSGVVTFPLVERAMGSVVLRWAGTVAVVGALAGLAGATPVPLGLGLAVAAVLAGRRQPALAWAVAAGLSPLLVLVPAPWLGGGVVRDLGLAGGWAEAVAVVSGGLAAVVLGRDARRHDDPGRAFAAVVAGVVGLATTWVTRVPADRGVGLAVGFLLVELAALAVRDDRLWRRIAAVGAAAVEGLAGLATACGVLLIGVEIVAGGTGRWTDATVWFGLLTLGWLAADLRRQGGRPGIGLGLLVGGGWAPSSPLVAVSFVASVAATGSTFATSVALLLVTTAALMSARPGAHVVGAVTAVLVPVALNGHPIAAVLGGAIGAGLVAEMSVLRVRVGRDGTGLLLPALLTVAFAGAVVGESSVLAGVLSFGVGAWLVAVLVDQESVDQGHLARLLGVAGVALVQPTPGRAAVVGGVALVLLGLDCLRLRDPRLVPFVGVVLPYGLVGLLLDRGISRPFAGVGVTLAGVVLAGLAAVVDDERWRSELVVAVLALEGIGLVLSGDDQRALADALLVVGAVLLGGGIALRRREPSALGIGALTAGVWAQLSLAHVQVLEPYALPVALDLLVVGAVVRRRTGLGSWEAYGPGLAVAGGLPLVLRLSGGSAGHALVAGAVGVAALVVGGHRRLSAPLVLGTGTCVVLTGYEALAVTATVPTWGWLALAGSILLVAGISIERTGVSPVDSGRRLVEVVLEELD